MNKIVEQTGLSSLKRTTGLGERKILNLKLEECCLGESVPHWCTVNLLLAYPKSVIGPTQAFTTVKKSPV